MKSLNDGRGERPPASRSTRTNGPFLPRPFKLPSVSCLSSRELLAVQHHLPPRPAPPVSAGEERGRGRGDGAVGHSRRRGGRGHVPPGGGEDDSPAGGDLPLQRREQTPKYVKE